MRGPTKRLIAWSLALVAISGVWLALGAPPASAGGSCHSSPSAARDTRVALSQLCFGPTVLYVKPGATVTWTNEDPFEHTVTGLGFQWGSAGNLAQGTSISYRFDQAGIFPYECMLHPGMVGAVVVGDAGSPGALQALAAPLLAQSSPASSVAAKRAQASTTKATASSASWRTVSLVAIALLLVATFTIASQRRRMVQPRSSGAQV